MIRLLAFILILISCSSKKELKAIPNAKCYIFLRTEVIKIKTDNDQSQIYGKIQGEDTLYWESNSYIENFYIPLYECSNEIIEKAYKIIENIEH